MFVGVHALAAMQTGVEALAITDDEGKAFLNAAQNVARHYSVETTQKTLDWIAFAGIGLQIYGTRAFAFGASRRNRQRPQDGGRRVVPFPAGVPAPQSPVAPLQPEFGLAEEHDGF